MGCSSLDMPATVFGGSDGSKRRESRRKGVSSLQQSLTFLFSIIWPLLVARYLYLESVLHEKALVC